MKHNSELQNGILLFYQSLRNILNKDGSYLKKRVLADIKITGRSDEWEEQNINS